jgi:hypothetical protein
MVTFDFGRPRHGWEDNIKMQWIGEIGVDLSG